MVFDIELEVDATQVEQKSPRFVRALAASNQEFIQEGTEIIQSQLQLEIKVSSGKLQSSVRNIITEGLGRVFTTAGYGAAADLGRRGFRAVAKKARALRFVIGTRVIFAKSANVGPAKGLGFGKRTLLNAKPRIDAMIQRINMRVLRAAA